MVAKLFHRHDEANSSRPVREMKAKCTELARVDLDKTHELAGTLWSISISYYEDVKKQAKLSFYSAIGLSIVGTGFLFYALKLMVDGDIPDSRLSLASGVVIQMLSGVVFYLYSRTSKQFETFHICLERSNRFLLCNSLCENLTHGQDAARQKLISLIANAPLLSEAVLKGAERQGEPEQTASPLPTQPAAPSGNGALKHDVLVQTN